MESGRETARLAALPRTEFEVELNARSAGVLGRLDLATRLTEWPIISQIADRFTAPHTALIAEAAHVVPPIGAQGLNMSLGDLRVLLDLAQKAPDDIGNRKMLDAYHKARHAEVLARVTGIDLLNRASMLGAQGLRDLRAGALDALYTLAPLRKTLMRAGLGVR